MTHRLSSTIILRMRVKYTEKQDTVRVGLRIPISLKETVEELSAKHIPPAKNLSIFFQYLCELGMAYYAEQQTTKMSFDGPTYQMDNLFEVDVYKAFLELHRVHKPRTTKGRYLTYLLALGIKNYKNQYTRYGFKK